MAPQLPTPKRVGTIAVGGALVNVAALGFPDGAAVVARSVTALLVLMLLVMVYTHREEWLDYFNRNNRVRLRVRRVADLAKLAIQAGCSAEPLEGHSW